MQNVEREKSRSFLGVFDYFEEEQGDIPIYCKIYVPRNSVSRYKSASYWENYASNIEGYDF